MLTLRCCFSLLIFTLLMLTADFLPRHISRYYALRGAPLASMIFATLAFWLFISFDDADATYAYFAVIFRYHTLP